MNDGYTHWKGFNLSKNEEGKYIVSHRFIDKWLVHKKVFKHVKEKAMDLLPLPYKIPYEGFDQFWIAFSLFDQNKKDTEVLSNLANLLGMKVEFTEEETTHLIINSDRKNELDKSVKIQRIKRTFTKRKPKVVLFEWFLQGLLNGKPEAEENYLIDIN